MFNKKILKLCLMLLLLIGVFHLLSNTNINFQKPENIEDFKCDKRLPHEREDFWDRNVIEPNNWGGKKKRM